MYLIHVSQKYAAEQPGEREVAMMGTEGTDRRGARADRKSPSDYGGHKRVPSSQCGAEQLGT